jgi:hypothetical protein
MMEAAVFQADKSSEPRARLRRIALACLPMVLVAIAELAYVGYGAAPLQALNARAQAAAGPDVWVELKNPRFR